MGLTSTGIKTEIWICYSSFIKSGSVLAQQKWGGPGGAKVKAMDCGIVVSEFEHQSSYYSHPWERYEPSYHPSYRLNSTPTVLLQDGFGI